jgi:hypothetical protein
MKEKTNQSLVNTSLPAKEAPSLKPATLASLTVKSDISATTAAFSNMRFEKKSEYQPLTKSSLAKSSLTKPAPFTSDDFPSLGSKKPATATASATVKTNATNYAALSRDWAKKQEEDKIAAKEEAEKEQHRQQVERMVREQNEKEFKEFRSRTVVLPSQKKADNDTRKLDIGCYESDGSVEEEYESPPEYDPEEEEEEDEEEEYNAHWGDRY